MVLLVGVVVGEAWSLPHGQPVEGAPLASPPPGPVQIVNFCVPEPVLVRLTRTPASSSSVKVVPDGTERMK